MNKNKVALPVAHGFVEVDADRIRCDNIELPGEKHRTNHLWVVQAAFSNWPTVLGAVWAKNEEAALHELVDRHLGEALLVSQEDLDKLDEDEREALACLGNADEACDLTNVGLDRVVFDPPRDWQLLCRFAEARAMNEEGSCETLDDVRER